MSLEDFWNNVTTPGFLEASFDDLKGLCNDIRGEAQELMEEGEEVFIDGFVEMVLKKNSDYKTSIEKKSEGNKIIATARQKLLKARGVTNKNRHILDIFCSELKYIGESLEEVENPDIESMRSKLQLKFPNITFPSKKNLKDLSLQIKDILTVPPPPSYEAPEPNTKSRQFGPVGIFTSDKEKRVIAADTYLEKITEYQKKINQEVKRQKNTGLIFKTRSIPKVGKKLIFKFGKQYWKINRWETTWPNCDDNNHDISKTKCFLMLSGGIYTMAQHTLPGTKRNNQVNKKLISELKAIKKQVSRAKRDAKGQRR